MEIIDAILSVKAIDLLMFFALFGMFILGFMQGIVRRLLGIASILISLLVASQLRDPLGTFLASNWEQYPRDYNFMIAFGTVFVGGVIASTIALQLFYRPTPLFAKYPVLDEVLGGVLGVFQFGLLLACFFLITDPFFLTSGAEARTQEFPFIREVHAAFEDSITATIVRERIIPSMLAVLGFAFADEVKDVFTS